MSGRHRKDDPALHGVLLVDKPAGPTSHDVVGWVRWVLGVRRVGHAGTLDPAATGLLVVAVGEATKLAPYLTGQDKGYRACFVLGASTTTGDAEGAVIDACACPADLEARVPAALAALRDVEALPPPAYSAIHVDGQRAHALARAGQAPVLEARPMTVHALVPGPVCRRGDRVEVEVELTVSKGTYVRSLAEALGRSLGVPAHLGALHRTRSGALRLDHAHAVTGLLAERLPPAPDRPEAPPRWRLRQPACEDPSEAPRDGDAALASRHCAAELLRARLLAPSEVVPMPVLRVSDDDSGRRAMARLVAGQTLSGADPGLPPVPSPTAAPIPGPESPGVSGSDPAAPDASASGSPTPFAWVAVAPVAGAGLVVARLEAGPGGVRLRPERVVITPPAHP